MDKAIEQVFKIFNHLAREIQVYLLSGFVIAVNAVIIDYFYYCSTLLAFIRTNTLIIPAVVALYLLGQFCMAFFYTILEWTGFDKKINRHLKFDYSVDSKSLPNIYKKNPELYLHFVERYIILTMMRWTITAACFINLIIDVIVLFKKDFYWQFLLTTIVFGIGTISFYLLTTRTEKDYADRIESLKNEH